MTYAGSPRCWPLNGECRPSLPEATMPAPINQENFYTVRAVPSPARPLFTNLNHLPLTTVMRPPSGEGNDNARSITEIQERLADANEAFRARRFGDALAAYQATAELIDALPAAAAAPAAGNDLGRFNRGRFDGVMTRVSVLARELYGARPSLNVVGHVVNRASDGTVRPNDVVASLYDVRRAQNSALNLRWAFDTPAAFALQLPHIREFVIPLCQGDCYHALGDFPRARDAFLQVASYPYLNAAIEAPLLWKRLAQNYLDWGDSLFRNDLSADALAIYSQVVGHASTPDVGSPLYVSQSLKPIGDKVRIALAAAGAAADPAFDALNPEIARIVCETRSRVLMID